MQIINNLQLLYVQNGLTNVLRLFLIFSMIVLVLVILLLFLLWVFTKRKIIEKCMDEIFHKKEKINYFQEEKDEKKMIHEKTAQNLSVVAVASMSPKPTGSQDAYESVFVQEAQAYIVAVADGLGSHPYAEKGSDFVVKKVVNLLEEALKSGTKEIDFDAVFKETQDALDSYIEQLLPKLPDNEKLKKGECFGTTLIVGIDYIDRFVAAYVGNGAIFNISGYFTDFSHFFYLPWNALSILNPHTVEQDGKEALYKLFSWAGKDFIPTVLEIKKNKDLPGDIFVIATDGVYSTDQSIPGKDDNGAIWIPFNKPTERLFEFLKNYLLNSTISENSLKVALENNYLTELIRKKEMDDCTTLGIFFTEKCIDYFRNKTKQSKDRTIIE